MKNQAIFCVVLVVLGLIVQSYSASVLHNRRARKRRVELEAWRESAELTERLNRRVESLEVERLEPKPIPRTAPTKCRNCGATVTKDICDYCKSPALQESPKSGSVPITIFW